MRGLFVTIIFLLLGTRILAQETVPGLINSSQTGLPDILWIDESAARVAKLIRDTQPPSLPKTSQILMTLTLSGSDAELKDENAELMGAARLDYLWNIGALDAAESLAMLYDWQSPLIRREVENIALLSTRPEDYCEGLLKDEYQEIQNGMKVYCYTRASQYDDAIAEFDQIQSRLRDDRRDLLERFLDLDETDPLRDEAWIELPPPFEFVLDESIGRPRGLKHLPPAYAYFSRESGVTPRTDLEISEELVHLGALPVPVLFAAYRDNQAAESGGAWGRAQVVQNLDNLDTNSSEDEILSVIREGSERFAPAELEPLFAKEAGEKLQIYNPENFESPELQRAYLRLALLGEWSKKDWSALADQGDPDLMLAFLIAHPEIETNPKQIFSTNPISRILIPAFFGNELKPLEASSFGEAIWQSLFVIDNYETHPEFQVTSAFQSLILSGLEDDARSIAISLIFEPIS